MRKFQSVHMNEFQIKATHFCVLRTTRTSHMLALRICGHHKHTFTCDLHVKADCLTSLQVFEDPSKLEIKHQIFKCLIGVTTKLHPSQATRLYVIQLYSTVWAQMRLSQ